MDTEQKRAIEEKLSKNELALFDLLKKDELAKAERDRVKIVSRDLLESIKSRLSEIYRFWETEQTKSRYERVHLRRGAHLPADAAIYRHHQAGNSG